MSHIVDHNESIIGLPDHIKLYAIEDVPPHWMTQLEKQPLNVAIEINDFEEEAVHALRAEFKYSGQTYVLVLDNTKKKSIWAISDKLLMMILPWITIFLVLASLLAKRFIRRLEQQFKLLLITIEQNESSDSLTQLSHEQPIEELAQFAQLFTQVWQQKIEILAREKQSLEYLSHELRTPIQSSLATLELIALKNEDNKAVERLSRALNRMTRLSNAILFLMESENTLPTYQVDATVICRQLIKELTPLATLKEQSILFHNSEENKKVDIVATKEVIETILSILLTNAVQHSDNTPIIISTNHHAISIKNKKNESNKPQHAMYQGFGIGLVIAKRLCNKFNLQLNLLENKDNSVIATISNN